MPDVLVDWVNTRGPVILDRLYDLLPLMVISAVSAALIVCWVLGEDRGAASTKPAAGHGSDCGQGATGSTEDPTADAERSGQPTRIRRRADDLKKRPIASR